MTVTYDSSYDSNYDSNVQKVHKRFRGKQVMIGKVMYQKCKDKYDSNNHKG